MKSPRSWRPTSTASRPMRRAVEAMESRVLLSAYGIKTLAYVGANVSGANPQSTLVADAAGNLYGLAANGGSCGAGAVFELAKGSNSITTLASFSGANGRTPVGALAIDPSGNLFGATKLGGINDSGTVFEVAKGSNTLTTLAQISPQAQGSQPLGGVTLDPSGNLYGTTYYGGTAGLGTAFEIASGSNAVTTLASFTYQTGCYPSGPVIVDRSGNLYGACSYAGPTNSRGTVFEIANGSHATTTIAAFGTAFYNPLGGLTLDSSGNLYGTVYQGGTFNLGVVYEVAAGSSAITTIAGFNNTNGAYPQAGLTPDAAGNLFGTTSAGGANGLGTVFEVAKGTTVITTVASFGGANGASPQAGVLLDGSGNTYGAACAGGANGGGDVFEIAKGSATIAALASFDAVASKAGPVTLDASGNLFGLTGDGGANNNGTVFEIPNGSNTMTTLASFNDANGANPQGLTADASGNVYGTTYTGGANNSGTVFEIARGSNAITVLGSFAAGNGANPDAGPTLDASGNLYGTTKAGGAYQNGTVYEIAKGSNTITTLVAFPDVGSSHGFPGSAWGGLTLDASGNIYGTMPDGGPNNVGAVFEIAAGSDALTTLAAFLGSAGSNPSGGVALDAAGNLYGTTASGGANFDGTVFEIARGSGAITTLAAFNGANGQNPDARLMLDLSGNLYGITPSGGAAGDGALFEVTKGTNTITTLVTFGGTNGANPAWATPDASGNFFGAATSGGSNGYGTIFEISPTARPPVALTLASGSNPSTTSQPLGFTATVGGGVPDGETVTLVDASNNNAVLASGTLSGGSAALDIPAGALLAGTHNLIAAYGGDANVAAGQSAPYAQTVQVAVTSVVVNGNNAALAGSQRSMVDSIVYTFSQAVTLAATNALTIGIHAGQAGTVPTLTWAAINPDGSGAGAQWMVTFSGNGVNGGSIADGVYDITLNGAAVSVEGNASATVASRPTDAFYRLYGDVTGDGRVNNADYNLLLNSFNLKPGQAGYLAALDATGTGSRINNADYNLFLNNFNMRFTGFAATI